MRFTLPDSISWIRRAISSFHSSSPQGVYGVVKAFKQGTGKRSAGLGRKGAPFLAVQRLPSSSRYFSSVQEVPADLILRKRETANLQPVCHFSSSSLGQGSITEEKLSIASEAVTPAKPDILVRDLQKGRMSTPQNLNWKTRLVERGFPDRSFDIEFWQEQGDEAIFAAAWEMVELAEEVRNGRKPALQKTVTTLKQISD
jgi:hypothetical protein